MDEIVEAIVLGIVQGATEFIPVSSSGHLVILPSLLGWEKASLLFDTVLHWGTLLAIFLVFWRDFWSMATAMVRSLGRRTLGEADARIGWFIVLGSVPAAVTGLFFKDFFEDLFTNPAAAGGFLLVTAGMLVASERMSAGYRERHALERLTFLDTLWIGVAQAIALAPGISRSGSTIAAGLVRGLGRDVAARFSFLLGTPAFLGAGLLQLSDALAVDPVQVMAQVPLLVVGFIASAVTGFVAIRFLLIYLRTHSLYLFAAYCAVVGVGVLAWNFSLG